ncbi:MAG: hypothetical protein GW859_06995 [Sphingomonadales bacterium]|nr:hypothetical protein [Sphingomonadales bacterium]
MTIALAAAGGCGGDPNEPASDIEGQLAELKALERTNEALRRDLAASEARRSAMPAKPRQAASPVENLDGDVGSTDEALAAAAAQSPGRCWQDYCPCDSTDPDYGYMDVPICRNLRGGVAVSDEQFSLGAASRDARKALREFERDNGAF